MSEIFPVFERWRKIKQIEGLGKILQGVMKVSCFLSVIENNKMSWNIVKLLRLIFFKQACEHKLWAAALQVFQKDLLGIGKTQPVRQLEKAGMRFETSQQLTQVRKQRGKVKTQILKKLKAAMDEWIEVVTSSKNSRCPSLGVPENLPGLKK